MTGLRRIVFAARLAWRQLVYDKPKLLAATLGVLFACVLVFMQLGFRDSLYTSAASAPLKMQAQLFLLHKQTEALWRPVSFHRSILMRALGLPETRRVVPLYMSLGQFKNMDTHVQRTLMIYGYDPSAELIRIDKFESFRAELQRQDTAMFDVSSRPEFGPVQDLIASGRDITEINGRKVKLIGTFSMGTTFAADGNVVMSDLNFHRVFPSRSPDQIDLGFVMLAPEADIQAAQAALLRLVGQEVRVLTYEQLVRFEQAYWENSAPLGFIFGFGTLMGLIVGMVIVYQILFTDIGNNIPQYATLVAMGYSQSYLRNIVFASSIYLAVLGFLPGVVLSTLLYEVAERSIFIPFPMGAERIASVFFFILIMCVLAGLLAIRKLKSTDPADMFS